MSTTRDLEFVDAEGEGVVAWATALSISPSTHTCQEAQLFEAAVVP